MAPSSAEAKLPPVLGVEIAAPTPCAPPIGLMFEREVMAMDIASYRNKSLSEQIYGVLNHVFHGAHGSNVGLIPARCAHQIHHFLSRVNAWVSHISIRPRIGVSGLIALFGVALVDIDAGYGDPAGNHRIPQNRSK